MTAIQLEFNIDDNSEVEIKLQLMQKQIDAMNESMGKVRRKVFAELGEVKKRCHSLERENRELKDKLKELNHEKTEWVYGQEGNLFDVRENKTKCG